MNFNSSTIKGPNKEINQDALATINKQDYTLIIVADGLGSSTHSHIGSKTAVIAVEKAIIQWRKLKQKNIRILVKLINFYWNLLIIDGNYSKKDCASTCLFSYIDKRKNQIVIGQLGDGLILFNSHQKTVVLKSKIAFNFTKSLSNNEFNDWNIKQFQFNRSNFNCLISTDGISEDIIENKEVEFTQNLIDNLEHIKKNKRNSYLRNLITKWPTKYHTDDKTICIIWNRKEK